MISKLGGWLAAIGAILAIALLALGWRPSSVGVGIGPISVGLNPPGDDGSTDNGRGNPSGPGGADTSNPAPPLSLSGQWVGSLSQQLPDGTVAQYNYTLSLTQHGDTVEGTATLTLPQPFGYYVAMEISGTLAGKTLRFVDGQIIDSRAPNGWLWCRKSVELDYSSSSDTLKGSWAQPGCGTGGISLQR